MTDLTSEALAERREELEASEEMYVEWPVEFALALLDALADEYRTRVEIIRTLVNFAAVKVWRDDVLVFDGVERSALAAEVENARRNAERELSTEQAKASEWEATANRYAAQFEAEYERAEQVQETAARLRRAKDELVDDRAALRVRVAELEAVALDLLRKAERCEKPMTGFYGAETRCQRPKDHDGEHYQLADTGLVEEKAKSRQERIA